MQTKAAPPALSLRGMNVDPLTQAYFEFNHLKQLYRQGWLRRGIPPQRCESVAEHSLGVALLALFLSDACEADLDRHKLLRMALLHDFGEISAGDLTPADGVSPEEKHYREERSVVQVLAKLPNGQAYVALWQEYEEGRSAEARLVQQIDRLEMALQATVYERQGLADLSEFFASVESALADPKLQALFAELVELRGMNGTVQAPRSAC